MLLEIYVVGDRTIMKNLCKSHLFVLSAPSGTGKTTLGNLLLQHWPDKIIRVITSTTRPPRKQEKNGIDYHFIEKSEFQTKQNRGEFLEFAEVFGFLYGTEMRELKGADLLEKNLLLMIDTQGALQVKKKIPNAVLIFISPPNKKELHSRLRGRNTETTHTLERRLKDFEKEMSEMKHYDYHIVNDDLQKTLLILKSIIIAEEHKIERG